MCTRILIVDVLTKVVVWDPEDVTILVRRGVHPEQALDEIRHILSDLDAPPAAVGARCWCGEMIPLPPEVACRPRRISAPRRQVLRGA